MLIELSFKLFVVFPVGSCIYSLQHYSWNVRIGLIDGIKKLESDIQLILHGHKTPFCNMATIKVNYDVFGHTTQKKTFMKPTCKENIKFVSK